MPADAAPRLVDRWASRLGADERIRPDLPGARAFRTSGASRSREVGYPELRDPGDPLVGQPIAASAIENGSKASVRSATESSPKRTRSAPWSESPRTARQ